MTTVIQNPRALPMTSKEAQSHWDIELMDEIVQGVKRALEKEYHKKDSKIAEMPIQVIIIKVVSTIMINLFEQAAKPKSLEMAREMLHEVWADCGRLMHEVLKDLYPDNSTNH